MSILRHPHEWLMLASDLVTDSPVSTEPEVLNLWELTAAEIKDYFDKGELKAEEIYSAEMKSDKPRKGILAAYAPKDSEVVKAEDDKGTTAQVSKDLS